MDPAFSSPRQAGAFALLLLLILLLPVLAGKWLLPPREQLYWPFSFHRQIFEEKGDIDIAFMSSSRLDCAIGAPYVQQKLSEKLGRKTVVRSLTWTWNGYDALYFIAQDLLEHRKVRMIVFCDLSPDAADTAHRQAAFWFRFADNAEALAGLPLKSKASFYASAILGMPQNLVDLLRPNLAAVPSNEDHWYYSPTNYTPHTSTGSSDVRVYSDASKASFRFLDVPLPRMQLAFVRKIGLLAREHQTQLVLLNVPNFADRKAAFIEETTHWPEAFGVNLPMVGIPSAILFAGMSDDDVRKLYHNPTHFNQNGQNYFTPLVTPSLIQIYEVQIKP